MNLDTQSMLNYYKLFQQMSPVISQLTAQQNVSGDNGKTISSADEYLSIFGSGNKNEINNSSVRYAENNPDGTLNLESGMDFFEKTIHLDDMDGDGKVTAKDKGEQFVNIYDLNKDGEVTPEEYLAGIMAQDKDKDGVISYSERNGDRKDFTQESSKLDLIESFKKIAESIDLELREQQRKVQMQDKIDSVIAKIHEIIAANPFQYSITDKEAGEIAESLVKKGGGPEEVELVLHCRNLCDLSVLSL